MTAHTAQQAELLWQTMFNAEQTFIGARMAFFQAVQSGDDVVPILEKALSGPSQRGMALRLLPLLDESIRRQVFPTLVELASVGHSHIQLVRDVIQSISGDWVQEHIGSEVEKILDRSLTYEEYRRLAELLDLLHSPYLRTLVQRAAQSNDLDIREVATDFSSRAQ
ncbi:MAG TPA: hypothetical protein VF116_20020 [Ktedonobacterales bacterium]